MIAVFLDTVGLLALWDESDQWHQAAQTAFDRLVEQKAVVLTTTSILLECGNAAARRPHRQTVVRLRQRLEASNLLVTPTEEDWKNAWRAYETGGAADAGIVDQISFFVMRRLGLSQAFTTMGTFARRVL